MGEGKVERDESPVLVTLARLCVTVGANTSPCRGFTYVTLHSTPNVRYFTYITLNDLVSALIAIRYVH